MTRVCSNCKGTGRRGGKPCPTCNPPGGLLDGPAAALRRARNKATGRKTTVTTDGGRKTVTTRAGWLAPTVTKTTGKKTGSKPRPAARKKPATTKATPPSTVSCVHGVPLNRPCKDC